MSDEQMPLEISAKTAWKHAHKMMLDGAVPVYLGINGMLALMSDSIRRYCAQPSREDLLSLVAHGLHALSLDTEEQEWTDLEEDDKDDEDDEDDDVPSDHDVTENLVDRCKHPKAAISELVCQLCGTYMGDVVDERSDQSNDPRFQPAPGSAKTEIPLFDVHEEVSDAEE